VAFDLDPSYKQVPERIADFKAKHPEGCLRPANPAEPYKVEVIGDRAFIVYTAAAYRTPDDELPGIGIAWEPFPGKTPYTKDSELQNAETSAWGRAIVAVLASESKAIASAEDVRNRQADHAAPDLPPAEPLATADTHEQIRSRIAGLSDGQKDTFAAWYKAQGFPPIKTADRLTVHQATEVLRHLQATPAEPEAVPDGSVADAAEKLHQRIDRLPDELRHACEDALVAGFDGRFPNDLRPEDFPEAWMVVTDFEAKAGEGPSGGELAARAAAKGIHEEERVAR
jgi:hypothetical protein